MGTPLQNLQIYFIYPLKKILRLSLVVTGHRLVPDFIEASLFARRTLRLLPTVVPKMFAKIFDVVNATSRRRALC